MSNLLEQLGLSKEEATRLLIEKAVDSLLSSEDDYGDLGNKISRELYKKTSELIEKVVDERVQKTISPLLNKEIQNFTIQVTNEYGEKKGDLKTLTEFAADKCSTYFQEKVDSSGKKSDGYGAISRIRWLLGIEFDRQIRKMSEELLRKSNELLIKSMAESVQSSLNEISKKIIK